MLKDEKKVLLITEANENVASGHLFECIAFYDALIKEGFNTCILVNEDMPKALKKNLPTKYHMYKTDIQMEKELLIQIIREKKYNILIFNLREIQNDFLNIVKKNKGIITICIDEFGHRKLDCDIIINPMIDCFYWLYDTKAKLYCGAEYLILKDKLAKYHGMSKKINKKIVNITVSMGGVDKLNTTEKVVRWIPYMLNNIKVNIILGGGYKYIENLSETVNAKPYYTVYHNIKNIYEIFYKSDIVICSGGNTLHELAAIGTPTIVIPSMPHELRNGKAFEKKGFSFCCCLGNDISFDELHKKILDILSMEVRNQMADCGKKISDGKGIERMVNIISSL